MRLKVQRSGQCKSKGLGNPSAPLRYRYSNSGRSQCLSPAIAPIDPREMVRLCIQSTVRSKVGQVSSCPCGGNGQERHSVNPAWSSSVVLSQLEMSGALKGARHMLTTLRQKKRKEKKNDRHISQGEKENMKEKKSLPKLCCSEMFSEIIAVPGLDANLKKKKKVVMFVP